MERSDDSHLIYSQVGQDLFAYVMTLPPAYTGPRTFLDIGSGHPVYCNNSYLLERKGWVGTCMEMEEGYRPCYEEWRNKSEFLFTDASKTDWDAFFQAKKWGAEPVVGFLSLDVDDSTRAVFDRFPFERVRCAVMTIEHDTYHRGTELRDYMRERLVRCGYQLICSDVVIQPHGSFEDWWVHPDLVDVPGRAQQLVCQNMDSAKIIHNMLAYLFAENDKIDIVQQDRA